MNKETKIEIIIIIVLVIILGVLLKLAIIAINENSLSQIPNEIMNKQDKNMSGKMSESSSSIEYSGVTEITKDTTIESGDYSSEKEDENSILVNGDINAELSNIKVDKTGDSDGGDNTSFYGINSAIITKSKANLNLKNITVTTERRRSKWSILLWW